MFGWEFPPFNKGGLGTACHGLTKGLANHGCHVTFVIPKAPLGASSSHVNLIVADNLTLADLKDVDLKEVDALLIPYISGEEYGERLGAVRKVLMQKGLDTQHVDVYGKNLYEEVWRYGQQARLIAMHEDFDVIHAHDWMTYQAGMQAKQVSGKPLVVHIHATEFDRTGGHPNQLIYDIEREGLHAADQVCAVSNYTKQMVVRHYGIPAEKVTVVHNAVEFNERTPSHVQAKLYGDDKVVLFLGRLTLQKGPDYFLSAAKRVLEHDKNVTFVIAGDGDMTPFIIHKAAEMGIANKVLFTGFLRGPEIDRAYQMADLYVMPSVSEPFGITPLEAMRNNTPVIISKTSGVSEVVRHCLKVDFWDIDQMANKMLSVLRHAPLHRELQRRGKEEVHTFTWDVPAKKCLEVYSGVLSRAS